MKTLRASKTVMVWTVAICVLVTIASILGLTNPDIYGQETKNWALQAKGQDIGNLLAVVMLLVSGYFYSKGSYRAALVWIGTLFYMAYAYIVYAVAVHFNGLFLVYVAVLGLSVWAALFSVNLLRSQSKALPDGPERKLAGYTLTTIGALFALLWLSELVPALIAGKVPQSIIDAGLWVNPIHVIDLAVVLPSFMFVGVMASRAKTDGLFFIGPWLVFSTLMGSSIVAAMVLMSREGFENVFPPMVMTSVVVAASIVAAWRFLRRVNG